jgi:hypothetical protein
VTTSCDLGEQSGHKPSQLEARFTNLHEVCKTPKVDWVLRLKDHIRVSTRLLEPFDRTQQGFCYSITGSGYLGGLRSLAWGWYLPYLQECSARSWTEITHPVSLTASGAKPFKAKILLFEMMAEVAVLVRNHEEISISEIVSHLESGGLFEYEVRPITVQMVFQMIGWMTALWDPAPEPSAKYLSLRRRNVQSGRRTGARKPVINNFSIGSELANQPLHRFLTTFGKLIPAPELTLRDEVSGGIESGQECVIASYVSIYNLQTVMDFKIEWTDTLAQHLEFETIRRVLRVFSHPSICLLLYRDQEDTAISKLFKQQLDEDFGGSLKLLKPCPNNIDIGDFLVEVILSYRLIFGHDRRSRAEMGRRLKRAGTKPQGPADPLLESLCTRDQYSDEIKQLHLLLESREFEEYVSLDEFPFLGRRLIDLERLSMKQGLRGWRSLWIDRRNVTTSWFTMWAVVYIGSLALIFQAFQLVFQIYQPLR